MTATVTKTLNEITRAEAEAEAAAVKAFAAAEAAKDRADRAREHAEREREAANRSYMELLTAEWPDARQEASAKVGEARTALEAAVREDGDVIPAYLAWVTASIQAWEVTEAVDRTRRFHGQNMRYQAEPAFDFGSDIGAIVNQIALELQQGAIDRIEQRRASFLAGKDAK